MRTAALLFTVLAVLVALTVVTRADARTSTIRSADIRWADQRVRNLWKLARCETGGINNGRPLWTHHNSSYTGALGFAHSTWTEFRKYVRPMPRARYAAQATPLEQYAVGLVLVERFGGYSSWPACSIRLGLRRA